MSLKVIRSSCNKAPEVASWSRAVRVKFIGQSVGKVLAKLRQMKALVIIAVFIQNFVELCHDFDEFSSNFSRILKDRLNGNYNEALRSDKGDFSENFQNMIVKEYT